MKLSLNKKDRICFLGDSITANGLWIAEIFEHFLKNYPELETGFYNCGVSGSKGYEIDLHNRLFCDCFNLFPRYVAVMFGMNDVAPYLYGPNCTETDRVNVREKRLQDYENSIEHIIAECEEEGVTPILCSPTPYDEYNDRKQENWMADCALKHCRDVVEKLADKHNLLFVDMRKILIENIAEKPVDIDRIHPNAYGQHLMSEIFLQTIGAKEKPELHRECILSARNKERYDLEHIIRDIEFVERDYMGWQYEARLPEVQDRKALVRERFKNENNCWAEGVMNDYINNVDDRNELMGRLVKLTRKIYK